MRASRGQDTSHMHPQAHAGRHTRAHTDVHTQRDRETQTHRHTHTDTHRHTHTHTHTDTYTHRQPLTHVCSIDLLCVWASSHLRAQVMAPRGQRRVWTNDDGVDEDGTAAHGVGGAGGGNARGEGDGDDEASVKATLQTVASKRPGGQVRRGNLRGRVVLSFPSLVSPLVSPRFVEPCLVLACHLTARFWFGFWCCCAGRDVCAPASAV